MICGQVSRREILRLSGVVIAGSTPLAGCTADGTESTPTVSPTTVSRDPPEATGANITVGYDETKTVTVTAANINRLVVSPPSNEGPPSEEVLDLIGYSEATMDPSPDEELQSLPPKWVWDTLTQEVSLTLPVSAPDTIDTGTYRFTVEAFDIPDDEKAEATLEIRVSESDSPEG